FRWINGFPGNGQAPPEPGLPAYRENPPKTTIRTPVQPRYYSCITLVLLQHYCRDTPANRAVSSKFVKVRKGSFRFVKVRATSLAFVKDREARAVREEPLYGVPERQESFLFGGPSS